MILNRQEIVLIRSVTDGQIFTYFLSELNKRRKLGHIFHPIEDFTTKVFSTQRSYKSTSSSSQAQSKFSESNYKTFLTNVFLLQVSLNLTRSNFELLARLFAILELLSLRTKV